MATQNRAAPSSERGEKQGGINYLATQSTFVAIATLVILARVYVRTVLVKKFGLDDAAAVLAWVCVSQQEHAGELTLLRS